MPITCKEPHLGLATTMELIMELEARCRVGEIMGEAWPKYRTVNKDISTTLDQLGKEGEKDD
jgi:hypothetical protein